MNDPPRPGDGDGLDLDAEIALQAVLADRADDPPVLRPETEERLRALLGPPS